MQLVAITCVANLDVDGFWRRYIKKSLRYIPGDLQRYSIASTLGAKCLIGGSHQQTKHLRQHTRTTNRQYTKSENTIKKREKATCNRYQDIIYQVLKAEKEAGHDKKGTEGMRKSVQQPGGGVELLSPLCSKKHVVVFPYYITCFLDIYTRDKTMANTLALSISRFHCCTYCASAQPSYFHFCFSFYFYGLLV